MVGHQGHGTVVASAIGRRELAQTRGQCGGHPGLDSGPPIGVPGGIDPAIIVQPRHQIAAIVGNRHVNGDFAGFHQLAQSGAQAIHPLAGVSRDEDRAG